MKYKFEVGEEAVVNFYGKSHRIKIADRYPGNEHYLLLWNGDKPDGWPEGWFHIDHLKKISPLVLLAEVAE